MNFIAHFHLSSDNTNFIIGNYLADMISHSEFKSLHPKAHEGVIFHRFIDHFTDSHPVVYKMKKLFYSQHGKYSPVLVDIFMDYSLYKNWSKYVNLDFDIFCEKIYAILLRYQDLVTPRLKPIQNQMIKDNWLREYSTYEGLERTFLRLGAIAKFSGNFNLAVKTYDKCQYEFDLLFNQFYPDIIDVCEKYQPSK